MDRLTCGLNHSKVLLRAISRLGLRPPVSLRATLRLRKPVDVR